MKLRKYLPAFILFTACAGAATVHAASVESSGTTWNEHEYLVVEGEPHEKEKNSEKTW